MIMQLLRFFLLAGLTFMLSCSSDPASEFKELELMEYGIPLKIMAPDSSDVKKEDWGSAKVVNVEKGDFEVQIWSSQASTTDIATLKANKLSDVKNTRIFSKIIKEEPNGFIFENQPDSSTLYYGFYYLLIQGDYEYSMQNGLRGNFTLEQAERMYEAVKNKKD